MSVQVIESILAILVGGVLTPQHDDYQRKVPSPSSPDTVVEERSESDFSAGPALDEVNDVTLDLEAVWEQWGAPVVRLPNVNKGLRGVYRKLFRSDCHHPKCWKCSQGFRNQDIVYEWGTSDGVERLHAICLLWRAEEYQVESLTLSRVRKLTQMTVFQPILDSLFSIEDDLHARDRLLFSLDEATPIKDSSSESDDVKGPPLKVSRVSISKGCDTKAWFRG